MFLEKEKLGKPVLCVLHPVWNSVKEHEYGIEEVIKFKHW